MAEETRLNVGVQQGNLGGKGSQVECFVIAAISHACIHELRDLQQLQNHWVLLCSNTNNPLDHKVDKCHSSHMHSRAEGSLAAPESLDVAQQQHQHFC